MPSRRSLEVALVRAVGGTVGLDGRVGIELKKGIKQNTGIVKAWKTWKLAGRSLSAIRSSDVSAWRMDFAAQD